MKLKLLFSFLFLALFYTINSSAQTTLTAGDVAITGFSTDDPDQFVFVLLLDVDSGTQIHFTDRGWNSTLGIFRAGEGTLTWTATSNLSAGTVIDVLDLEDPFSADNGTITDDNNFQLSASGDQILVYQGTDISPTFLNAIHMDGNDGGWSNATGTNDTALPPGLTDGVNATYFDEVDNGSFICPSDPFDGTSESLLAAIMDISNWELENGPFTITTTLGGGCAINVIDPCTDPSSTDSDNDGINDICDLDDDNDGIPDTAELGTIVSTEQQPCGGDTPLDFSATPTLISGTDLLQGAVYRFPNISSGMDALVTIVETNNATVTELDRNATSPESFKPRTGFNFTYVGERGYIEYRIQFVNSGGTTAQTIDKFFMNFNDLDGNSNFGEQNWADNPKTYTIDNPTELTMNTDGSWIIATGAPIDYGTSTNEIPLINFAVNYTNKSEISIRVGAVARTAGASASGRSHSIEFNCVTNYVSPETYALDIDYDGLANHLDLDSDNDGILDADESGHTQTHVNGVVNGPYGTNGLADSVETSPESDIINYTITDTDGIDGSNFLDIDSDSDNCFDALEGSAGYAYTDINILSGQLLSSIDGNGVPGGTSQGIGSSTNNTIQSAICNVSSAMIDFDGVDDYVVGTPVLTNFTQSNTDGVTIMGWIKSDSDVSDLNRKFVFGERESVELYITDEDIRAYIHIVASDLSTATHDVYRTTTGIQRGVWRHVTIVVSFVDNQAHLLLDGDTVFTTNLFDAIAFNSSITAPAEDFRLGNNPTLLSTGFFKGNIDEIRIFNKVMLEDEIKHIVFQEIENNSGLVGGRIIHNTLNNFAWSDLQLYYPLSIVLNGKIPDESDYNNAATLYNITSLQEQTAPMPFTTIQDGNWHDKSTWKHGNSWFIPGDEVSQAALYGNDEVLNWGIYHIKNNVTLTTSMQASVTTGSIDEGVDVLGLIIDEKDALNNDVKFTIGHTTTDLQFKVNKYLELNGTLDLQGDSQLIQGITSDLVTSAAGKILRRQEGNANSYWYNYWASPVGSSGVTSLSDNNGASNNPNNTPYALKSLKDGTGTALQFTNAFNDTGKISRRWLYNFTDGVTYYHWVPVDENSNLNPGIGYTQKGTGNTGSQQQYTFEGKPNNGTILINATDTGGPGSTENVSLTTSLIGNPYPSALDARQFITDNASVIGGTILLWEQWAGNSHYLAAYEGGYGFINSMSTARAYQYPGIPIADQVQTQGIKRPTFYIPVAQGFFVDIENDGDIQFNNNQRVFIKESDVFVSQTHPNYAENGSSFFRNITDNSPQNTRTNRFAPEDLQLIRLEFAVSNGASRRFVLGFSNDTSDAFDYGFDGGLINAMPDEDMTSLMEGKPYVLQAFSPITPEKIIDLNFNASGNYTYSLDIVELQGIDDAQSIYLKDNQENITWDLRQGPYNFSALSGQDKDRFDIVFRRDTLSNEEYALNDVIIFVNNTEDKLFVKGLTEHTASLTLTNMLGQQIKTFVDVPSQKLENGLYVGDLSAGVYLVNLNTQNNKSISKKVIIE